MKNFITLLIILSFASCNKNEIIQGEKEVTFTVLEYMPAPGQFINENMTCTTHAQAAAWAQQRLGGKLYVSLGAFGGYITVKASKPIGNKAGYDFGVAGNPIPTSSEPGIVWVSEDANGNGKADDIWYELKGSDDPVRNYEVVYVRPASPGDVSWSDNAGGSGVVKHLSSFHAQNYFPAWVIADSQTLGGSMLPSRSEESDGDWVNPPFGWGYADNIGSDALLNQAGVYQYNRFDISNAVDSRGNPVSLAKIDFIKVQTAIQSNAGRLGEVSTEVTEFRAL